MLFPSKNKDTLRDRLWVWGHPPNSHAGYDLPGTSRMTPAEGALYLTIPNLIMVGFEKEPRPPFDQLALSFRSLDRVVWSVVSAGGATNHYTRNLILRLPYSNPNIKGFIFDDFWSPNPVMTVEEVRQIKNYCVSQKLDMWGVFYTSEVHQPDKIMKYLPNFDHLTLWFWNPDQIIEQRYWLERLRKIAPDKKIYLGCYLWDFGNKKPMPPKTVEMQVEYGFNSIHSGEIEGMVFIGTPVLDLGLASVEYVRQQILDRGEERIKS